MNITNKYLIVDYPVNPDFISLVIQKGDTVRTNDVNNKCIVKLPIGDNNNYQQLKDIKKYSHDEILNELKKPEWLKDNPFDAILKRK